MTTGTEPTNRPRRSRARTFLPLALAAWLVLEIWLLTLVAGAANGFTVLLLLVAGAVLGAAVVKRAGRRAFRNLTETLQQMPGQPGAPPTGKPAATGGKGNGFLMLGGVLLMIPGMISDLSLIHIDRAGTPNARWNAGCGRRPQEASRTPSSRPGCTGRTERSSRARSSARTAPTPAGARTTGPGTSGHRSAADAPLPAPAGRVRTCAGTDRSRRQGGHTRRPARAPAHTAPVGRTAESRGP